MKTKRRSPSRSVRGLWRAALLCLAAALLLFASAALRRHEKTDKNGENGGKADENGEKTDYTLTVFDAKRGEVFSAPLEEYLCGVVAAEMPASFAHEALKAQAVAARTYTVLRMSALGGSPCGRGGADICTRSDCCQAWKSNEELLPLWKADTEFYLDKVASAVSETRGVIALYEGRPIEALYHASSGGMTEAAADVFGEAVPYLVSVPSPGEEGYSRFSASFSFTPEEFVNAVNDAFPGAKLTVRTLEDGVELITRAEGGRVTTLRLGAVFVTGRELRRALGLPSACFTLSVSPARVRIDTRGLGHGVGMSQYGADAMARAGSSFQEILLHYYRGMTLGTMD